MTTTPRIFRNCALSLPLMVLGAGGYGGLPAAAEIAIAGSVGVMNLAIAAWLGTRMVEFTASGVLPGTTTSSRHCSNTNGS